jgi:hypothetical protein
MKRWGENQLLISLLFLANYPINLTQLISYQNEKDILLFYGFADKPKCIGCR